MSFKRASGILLHPTSLSGDFGIGDLGEAAYEFVDFLERAGQTYWQILPLGPTGLGNSPYSAFSAFAGNTLLISPSQLVVDGLLSQESVERASFISHERVNYDEVRTSKNVILAEAFERFRFESGTNAGEFIYFCSSNGWWLDDYALFCAVRSSHGQSPWYEWSEPLRLRDAEVILKVKHQLAREIEAEKF
ncbi:MAG: 4-alpha-glucanotransferase, partial [Pyrinomonadaceae bacterium]